MKPPTTIPQAVAHTLFLLLVVGEMTQEALAYHHPGYKSHHHEAHHAGHHEGHHHSSSVHHGHHGVRAPRTRREKAPGEEAEMISSPEPSPETDESIHCSEISHCSGLDRSSCDISKSLCVCPVDFPISDYIHGVCVAEAKLDSGCTFDTECDAADEYSFCGPERKCICKDGYNMKEYPNVGFSCVRKNPGSGNVDPAMIGVLVGMALMFVIICVVLRLFSKARFRENRSIFNTPNPRLMNASLFKDSKLLSPARGERRGSRASVRAPSRAASVTSVNAASRSPNGSLAKG